MARVGQSEVNLQSGNVWHRGAKNGVTLLQGLQGQQ